jgi:hypothetical protein
VPVKTTPSFIYIEKPGKNRLLEITRLIRLALGLLVRVWILFQMFTPPKDPKGDPTWLYLGLIAVPFGIICAIAVKPTRQTRSREKGE